MTRRPESVTFWQGRLPHWEVVDGRDFVTIHLSGAIPPQGQQRIRALSEELRRATAGEATERLRLQRRVLAEIEAWLDRARTVCHLGRADIGAMIMEAVEFRRNRQWNIFEYVVMPNHLHLFFELLSGDLKSSLEQFKRWTGHEASRLLGSDHKRFWQDEWFDHWSRSDEEDEKIVAYIRRNPEKAGLVESYHNWPYGSWAMQRGPSGM